MQPKLKKMPELSRMEFSIGNCSKFGKLVVLNISTSELKSNVANNSKVVLTTLDPNIRPKESLIINPVIGRDESYAMIPNCYVILRNTGVFEFYQASGATKNVKQILGQISYFVK